MIEEQGTDFALVLRRCPLIAPALLVAECANILRKRAYRDEIRLEAAVLAARHRTCAKIGPRPMRPLKPTATVLTLALDRPAYDCVSLVLAEATELPFVTADARLLSRTAQGRAGHFSGRAHALADAAAPVAHERG